VFSFNVPLWCGRLRAGVEDARASLTAVEQLRAEGKSIAMAHFKHIKPLPKNTSELFSKYKKIIVCEINLGQFVNYLRMRLPEFTYEQYNKIQGLPFMVNELKEKFSEYLSE
jgi:2-oxoglutarate ferredoxin oxidoreductase subunit alpha